MNNLKTLNTEELLLTNGGHDGAAYNIGTEFGKAFTKAAIVFGVAVAFLMPKS